MELSEYQRLAKSTIITTEDEAFVYGLISEMGEVFSAYKKILRTGKPMKKLVDTPMHRDMKEQIGDVLWYLSAVATTSAIDLGDAAKYNLEKTSNLFGKKDYKLFDNDESEEESLPRVMNINFIKVNDKVEVYWGDDQIGDPIDSNSHQEDDYRYHDVFHFAYQAVLGWSPVVRSFIKHKRKTKNPDVDRVEDGARARIMEEAASAILFELNKEQGPFSDQDNIPIQSVVGVMSMMRGLEVKSRNVDDWRMAISAGFSCFEKICGAEEATIKLDMNLRSLEVVSVVR